MNDEQLKDARSTSKDDNGEAVCEAHIKDDLKLDINNFLWPRLPGKTTLGKADRMAGMIHALIVKEWETLEFDESPQDHIPGVRKKVETDKLKWRCSKCGAWHKKQGYHHRTVAAQVPEAEDEFCSDGCPFNTRESDDGYYCILGLHIKPQIERECKPGPGCPLIKER